MPRRRVTVTTTDLDDEPRRRRKRRDPVYDVVLFLFIVSLLYAFSRGCR